MMRPDAAILRLAACLVPGPDRSAWLAEWRSELWYVTRSGRPATAFCLGAFKDAAWVRRNHPGVAGRPVLRLQSPARCLLVLSVLAGVNVFFAMRLPWPHNIASLPYREAGRLVAIATDGHLDKAAPTVSIRQYRALANHEQREYSSLVFYQPALVRVRTPGRAAAELTLAIATGDLADLLDLPGGASGRHGAARLVVSRAAWRNRFGGDSDIVGSDVEVAGKPAMVSAVVPETWRLLPGRVDGWLIEGQSPAGNGFVLGRLRRPPREWQWHISAPNGRGGYDGFECASLSGGRLIVAQVLMIALAVLIVSIGTSLRLGEYPAPVRASSRSARSRRWVFFGLKLAFLGAIVCCGGLNLLTLIGELHANATFLGYVLAIRWALIDQKQRCPECLRPLINPTRIGQPSQTFLEWYGTELVCARGHGLLHVPEIPTISFGAQRWLYLDPSWRSLFGSGNG